MEKPKQTRRSRFERDPVKKGEQWEYTKNDALIVRYLARYRYLRGKTIKALHHAHHGTPAVTVAYSLNKLHKHGIINKPRAQRHAYNRMNDTDIYELDNEKGYAQVRAKEPEATNLTRQGAVGYDVQFRHSMWICDSVANIELGTLLTPGYEFIPAATILAGRPRDVMRLPCSIKHRFEDGHTEEIRKNRIIPDAMFGIRRPDGKTYLYLMEINNYTPLSRNTLDQSSTLKKFLSYQNVRETKAIKQLGKSTFRVLFLFPRYRSNRENTGQLSRLENAQALIEKLYGSSDLFLLNYMAIQEEEWKYPEPFPELFTGPWQRGGLPPITLLE